MEELVISVPPGQNSLLETLSAVLEPAGLHATIDRDGQAYITRDLTLVTTLPEYSMNNTFPGTEQDSNSHSTLTKTEQLYIEGRKAGLRETIVIGEHEPGTVGKQSGAVVYGKIVDSETNEPLIGATIYVQELKRGAATDVDGIYSIVLPPGKYTIDFNSMGLEAEYYYLDVRSGVNMDIRMEKSLIPISEVVIKSSRYHNVKGTQMGFERLNYKEVKEIPVVLGEKDLLKIVQMLPGVQNVGEGTMGFNVRGSPADQNMIYINKVAVYNSSHLFGFFSSLSQDIIKDFSLYKSNLPAKYGDRLASFIDISTRQGNMNSYTARGGISPVTGHIAVEGPVVRNKSAFVLSARSTYSDWLLERLEDPELRQSNASFYDLAGTLTWKPDENNLVKTFGYYSRDRLLLGSANSYEYSNAGGSINLRHRFNPRISGDVSAVFGEYAFRTVDETLASYGYRQHYRIDHFRASGDFTWLSLGAHTLTFGLNSDYYRLNRGSVEPSGELSLRNPVNLGTEDGVETALYLADEITISSKLTLYGGIRYSHFMALGPDRVLEFKEGLPRRISNITDTLNF